MAEKRNVNAANPRETKARQLKLNEAKDFELNWKFLKEWVLVACPLSSVQLVIRRG